jgi:hypothetical protein
MKPKFIPLIKSIDYDYYALMLLLADDAGCEMDYETALMMLGL